MPLVFDGPISFSGGYSCRDLGGHLVTETETRLCRETDGEHAGDVRHFDREQEVCEGATRRICPGGKGLCPLDSDTPFEDKPEFQQAVSSANTATGDLEQQVQKREASEPPCRDDDDCCKAWERIRASDDAVGSKKEGKVPRAEAETSGLRVRRYNDDRRWPRSEKRMAVLLDLWLIDGMTGSRRRSPAAC